MSTEVKELLAKKDQLEAELHELENKITAINKAHNLEKGTVDEEGFPRADLDFGELSNYRNLKKRKAQINNDHFAIMKQIQKRLHQIHQSYPDVDPAEQEVKPKEQDRPKVEKKKQQVVHKEEQKKPHNIDYITPFAKLTIVENDSPASKAGLKVGDLLSQFSQVCIYSIDPMKQIPKHVKQGHPIDVVVMRPITDGKTTGQGIFLMKDGNHYQKITLKVVPNFWQGRGMLGCKIDPLIQQ